MGKLLDALKEKNIDLNKTVVYADRYVQDQAKIMVLEMFNKLPKEKRFEILDRFLSPEAKDDRSQAGFKSKIMAIKEEGPEASRKFLTNSDNFGRDWRELVVPMEERLGGWTESHYREDGIGPNSPPEDKLNCLFRCDSFKNRMDFMWSLVDDKRKPEYHREFLPETTRDPNVCVRYFNTKGTFADGMDWGKFAEAVDKSLDEVAFKEAEEKIGAFKQADHKETVDRIWESVGQNASYREDRLAFLMRNAMLTPDAELDPDDLREKVDRSKWNKLLDPVKKTSQLMREGKIDLKEIVGRSRRIINDAPEGERSLICKKAALQNYRDLKLMLPVEKQNGEAFKEMNAHAAELQLDVVKANYKDLTREMNDGRALLDEQIRVIEKEKEGLFLSKTDSPEHKRMTKNLRLFNAKLDMALGKEPAQNLSAQELEIVKNSDIKTLYDEAKYSAFDYSCLKTKNGKGGILHQDGRARNEASRNAFDLLSQMGSRLGLCDEATEMKDQLALDVLRYRGSKAWEELNAEDYAAKTIYTLSLTHGGLSSGEMYEKLSKRSVERSVKEIKQRPEFKQMVEDLGPTGLCEAMVKGGGALTLAYAKAAEKLNDPQAGKGKDGAQMSAQTQREFWSGEVAKDEAAEKGSHEPLPMP